MGRKKLRRALKGPTVVRQVRLRDGRTIDLTGNDDTAP
jgi:hypothetical protein